MAATSPALGHRPAECIAPTPREYSSADVTVAVLNYNGRAILADCLTSIQEQDASPGACLLVDDGSTDGSPEWVSGKWPAIRVVSMGKNTKRLNMVRNRALMEAATPLVLLVDNDVVLAPDCLAELLEALRTLPGAAVCMPRTLYKHDPSLIYQDGQILHYVGATYALHRNQPVSVADEAPRRTIGWGVQLIERDLALAIGGFNEAYLMGWGDDGEFNQRVNLTGRVCYHVPKAVVYHQRVAPAHRYFGTVTNRWRFLLECYQLRTLVLCAPALAVYEMALFGFLLSKGAGWQYVRAIAKTLADLPDIWHCRKQAQKGRQVADGELMTAGPVFVDPTYVSSRLLAAGYATLTWFLTAYWRIVRGLLT